MEKIKNFTRYISNAKATTTTTMMTTTTTTMTIEMEMVVARQCPTAASQTHTKNIDLLFRFSCLFH